MKKPRVIAYSVLFAAAIVTVAVSATSASTARNAVNTPAGPVKGAVSAGGGETSMYVTDVLPRTPRKMRLAGAVSEQVSVQLRLLPGGGCGGTPPVSRGQTGCNVGVPSMPNLPSVGDLPGAGSLPLPSAPAVPSVPSLPNLGGPTSLLNGVTNVLPSVPSLPGAGSITGLLP